jgi:hypothetical protein
MEEATAKARELGLKDATAKARELGPKLATFLKIVFILVFGVLAATTRDTTQIRKKGLGLLVAEAFVVGAGAALSFALVARIRSFTGSWAKLVGISFAVFFILHFLFELSGFNEISETASTGAKKFADQTKKVKKSKAALVIIGLLAFIMAMFTLCAWDAPPPMTSQRSLLSFFLVQPLVIGLGSAIPAIMIAKDRDASPREVKKSFLFSFILFGPIGHFGLQYSGLYREFGFMPSPEILSTGGVAK